MRNRLLELEQELLRVKNGGKQKFAEAKTLNPIQQTLTNYFQSVATTPAKGPTYHDAWVWEMTMRYPTHPWQRDLLIKLFTVMKVGRLAYRTQQSNNVWRVWNLPLAAALSHGGRVMIQYPSHTNFWTWLTTGVTLSRRHAATHGVKSHPRGSEQVIFMDNNAQVTRTKNYVEEKYDTKTLGGNISSVNVGGTDWGVNLPMGGDSNVKGAQQVVAITNPNPIPTQYMNMLGTITSNGRYGHLYIYHHGPHAGEAIVMVGLESSGSGEQSILGKVHDATGAAGAISGAYGVKFTHQGFINPRPDEFDSMFVKLDNNWQQQAQNLIANWNYAFLNQPA